MDVVAESERATPAPMKQIIRVLAPDATEVDEAYV